MNALRKTLRLNCVNIETLPDNLEVDNLSMMYGRVNKLPKGLKVQKDLNIPDMLLDNLPDDLEVGRFIFTNYKRAKMLAIKFPKFKKQLLTPWDEE